jgi:hypothetical protein
MFGDAAQQMMEGMTEAMGQTVETMGNAMMEEMQKGFQQFIAGGTTKSQMRMEPEEPPEERKIRIKFGYMKKRVDGSHYVYKETKKIPMRTSAFRWGYSIEAEDDGDPFTTYSIDYSPDGPMNGSGYPRTNAEGERGWESNTNTITNRYFSRAYRNDPGDTPGERAIEIYIDDKLATKIEFEIDNP